MSEAAETIAHCPDCGVAMDVSELAPFTKVVCPECGGTTRVKRAFGPYTLVRRHAVGGMSMVFVAHDATLDREVALKILSEEFSADERRIAAFEEEARITASFSHPNVVRVFKTGHAFGRFYIAMELVPGGHFEQQIIERGSIPEVEVLPLAIEVAQGLKAAHAAGLIHRDVKPGNILLDAGDHAKLVDFGLALVTHGGKATATELWATPYYVPPETVAGQAEDFRSDIYAFGATLYHALSGKPPCGEESMATDRLCEAKKTVVPLSVAAPSVSEATCRIVDRAMAYSPAGRFTSYEEMIAALTSALSDLKSGKARPSSRARTGGRKRSKFVLYASSGGLAAVAVVAWFLFKQPYEEPLPVAPPPAPDPVVFQPEDREHAAEIGRNYREASAAVEAGDFELAERRFGALFSNPRVQEPTRSWAGLQALLAAMLDARPQDAISQIRPIRKHLRSLAKGHPLAGGEWDTLLGKMDDLWPLPATDGHSSAVGGVIANMLAGLKNWDQGLLDEAAICFRAAHSVELSPHDAWAAVYQKIAADHLDDHQVLTGPLFNTEPANASECRALIDRLDEALAVMKTRGRARFNVRSWQLDLKRREKSFEAAAAAAVPAPVKEPVDEVAVRLEELTRAWRFAEAVTWLRELPDYPPLASRDSLIAMNEDAALFLAGIQKDLAAEPFTGELPLADSGVATRVAVDEEGNIRATMVDGGQRTCAWSDFSPDALIAMHRVLVKKPQSETERLRRHECAIAFDWLVGNRERALAAAAVLAQGNTAFKQRWDSISEGLPK